jgi:hypothetical protein
VPGMKRIGRPNRRVTIGLTLFGIAFLIAATWAGGFFLHDSSQAASISEALRRYRASDPPSGGLNGVYAYATKGSESISALGGATHAYPAKTSITAVKVPCGMQYQWAALGGRSTGWTFCSTAAGIELRISDERHTFFGQGDRAVYRCSGRLLIPKKPTVTAAKPFSCRSDRNLEVGTAHVLGPATVEIGTRSVPAIRVSTDLTIRSRDSGNEWIDWWLDSSNGLPLRVTLRSRTSREMWIGRVRYREDFSLRLLSLTPMH